MRLTILLINVWLIESELESEARLAAGRDRVSVAGEDDSEAERKARLMADGDRDWVLAVIFGSYSRESVSL